MTEPLVSVHMITYNHAPFIAQAIEGVLMQKTNFPFELVIGEDCSTDGTREIVFDYQTKYPEIIRVITSDKNVGARKNVFRTWKACRGKYIASCEGDDYWHHPDKLQKQVDYLESHPECGLVYSSFDVYHVRSKKKIEDFIKYRKWEIPKNPNISDFVEGRDHIQTLTVMARRILCEQIVESDPYLHQSGQFLMGDTQLWTEIATVAQIKFIPESLATHNILNESATRSNDIKKILRFNISQTGLWLYFCDKYNLESSIRKKLQQDMAHTSLRLAFHSENAELAREVRGKKGRFTLKDWFFYYGARNRLVYYFWRVASASLKLFRKQHDKWL